MMRIAPSFKFSKRSRARALDYNFAYSVETLAECLGWKDWKVKAGLAKHRLHFSVSPTSRASRSWSS
jgi:hypothetical protein